jgi:cobyrinic acid a,c-diamide synthase
MIATPRLVIAGTHSGVGKTTVATALMAAFARRGLRVQPFKIGPDFIDPGFHRLACGRISRNLDGWMLGREANLQTFADAAIGANADLAIIEGVMGLFDGRAATSEAGSTGEMAKWLQAPVILVVDASAMARTAAALVRGMEDFDPALTIAGVLFNRTGGPGHAAILREATARYCRAKSLGALPRQEGITLPERHLGLVMAAEILTPERLTAMADWVEAAVDLDALFQLAMAAKAATLSESDRRFSPPAAAHLPGPRRPRIGIARDAAFCFYYQDNLDLLTANGADLIEFSPIADAKLPANLDGIYLGGGYPELHAAKLSANHPMLDAIRRFAQSGAPIYAECGGFMYLTQAIVDATGAEHPMAGLFPTKARMSSRLAALGYVELKPKQPGPWLDAHDCVRGHEFRYSAIDEMPASVERQFIVTGKSGTREEGYSAGSVVGGYVHLHFRSLPRFAARFVNSCRLHL